MEKLSNFSNMILNVNPEIKSKYVTYIYERIFKYVLFRKRKAFSIKKNNLLLFIKIKLYLNTYVIFKNNRK